MTDDELINEIYDAPFIVPDDGLILDTRHNGGAIVKSRLRVGDNEVLDFMRQIGGRWVMWTFSQENPYFENGWYCYVLREVTK